MVKLKVEIKIRFRAFGVTFANVSDTRFIDLPPAVKYVEQILHFEKIAYNDHGVSVTIALA